MGINKAFEVEVEFERIYIRDAEAVGDEGVGAAASADVMVACGLGVADDIPGDEEVGGETELADDFEFAFHSGMRLCTQGLYSSAAICDERSRTISAAAAFAGEFVEEQEVIALGAGESLAVVFIAAGQFGFAVIEEGFGVAEDLGIGSEGVVDIFTADPLFAGAGAVGGIELAEHDIEVYAAHELVDLVAGFVFVGDGLPYHEAIGMAAEIGGEEAVDFGRHDADVFVGAEIRGNVGGGAIDDVDMLHFRGSLGEREAVEGAGGEEFAEFAPAFGVAGDAGVEVVTGGWAGFGIRRGDDGGAGAEFDAEDGFDVAFAAFCDPFHGAGGIVDVSQCQGGDTPAGGAFGQLFGRQGAIFEGII